MEMTMYKTWFNRDQVGIRVSDPRSSAVYAPSDSARLLLNIGTMPYEGPVMPFLRPYHLWRPIQISPPYHRPSIAFYCIFCGRWFLELSERLDILVIKFGNEL